MTEHRQTRSGQVLASVREFLGGPTRAGERWAFEFGPHLESNWGAAYAGALAASTLAVARSTVPECAPRSLHLQMVRTVPTGMAFATAEVRHAGRTVSTVEVDLFDAREKLAAIAVVTMVTPCGPRRLVPRHEGYAAVRGAAGSVSGATVAAPDLAHAADR